jgi:hypothetical protein
MRNFSEEEIFEREKRLNELVRPEIHSRKTNHEEEIYDEEDDKE